MTVIALVEGSKNVFRILESKFEMDSMEMGRFKTAYLQPKRKRLAIFRHFVLNQTAWQRPTREKF